MFKLTERHANFFGAARRKPGIRAASTKKKITASLLHTTPLAMTDVEHYLSEKQAFLMHLNSSDFSKISLPDPPIEEMKKIILDALGDSILRDTRTITYNSPYPYNRDILNILKPIFKAYGIKFTLTEGNLPHEYSEELKLEFPEDMTSINNLPESDEPHKKWLENFLLDANIKIAKTNQRVQEEYSFLIQNLYGPIKKGEDKNHIEFQPCPFAWKRFEKFAKDENLEVKKYGVILTIERNEKGNMPALYAE